jgi:hypothetical protein
MSKEDLSGFKKDKSYNGLPYRGEPMIVDARNQPVMGYQVHIKRFDLSDEDHLAEYTSIFQRKADGLCEISFEDRQYVPEKQQWVVLLRWFDKFYKSNKE